MVILPLNYVDAWVCYVSFVQRDMVYPCQHHATQEIRECATTRKIQAFITKNKAINKNYRLCLVDSFIYYGKMSLI